MTVSISYINLSWAVVGIIDKDERVVCICTGNALKDPDTIIAHSDPVCQCPNDVAAVRKILLG